MEASYKGDKGMKCLIFTTWKRSKSISSRRRKASSSFRRSFTSKIKLWAAYMAAFGEEDDQVEMRRKRKQRVAPEGCFSVYVGAERQRFVIRAERANHPLFKMLLEEAESEYGYSSQGPLWLPCKVGIFYKVLKEMDDGFDILHSYGHPKLNGSYRPLCPSHWME